MFTVSALRALGMCLLGAASTAAQSRDCARGQDCGGQVYNECGTACPAICGEPTPMACTMQCVGEYQCPGAMLWDGDSGTCVRECDSDDTEHEEPARSCETVRCMDPSTLAAECEAANQTFVSDAGCCGECQALSEVTASSSARPTCARGQDCGGQVFNECGTACPAICGEPTPTVCTRNCVAEYQCPDAMLWDGDSGTCVRECDSETADRGTLDEEEPSQISAAVASATILDAEERTAAISRLAAAMAPPGPCGSYEAGQACITSQNLQQCYDLLRAGCAETDLMVMESCPLQFSCASSVRTALAEEESGSNNAEEIAISSEITLTAEIAYVEQNRAAFDAGFSAAMASRIGAPAESIVVVAVRPGSVVVEFHVIAPASVAADAASLVKTAAASDSESSLAITVGDRTLTADLRTMTDPVVSTADQSSGLENLQQTTDQNLQSSTAPSPRDSGCIPPTVAWSSFLFVVLRVFSLLL